VGWIGQLAVDAPGGYFGKADELTDFGWVYGIASLALGAIAAAGYALRARWAPGCLFVLILGTALIFLPPLAADPIVCLGVIAWQLGAAGRTMFDADETSSSTRRAGASDDWFDLWYLRWRSAIEHALILSIGCTTGVVGFALTHLTIGPVSCLVIDVLVLALAAPLLWRWASRSRRVAFLLLGLLLILGLVAYDPRPLVGVLGVYQTLLLAVMVRTGPLGTDLLRQFLARPAYLLMVSFAGTCVVGGVLLTFPSSSTGRPIEILDALFTATSAVCVTGLVVLDTPTVFSPFGQVLILLLIQVGGLGIMVLSTFATLLIAGRLGLRGQQALEEVLEMNAPGQAYRLARFIVLSTLGIEAVGAFLLALAFRQYGFAWSEAVWRGVFHSISAFCNAGFALQSDSLIMFQRDPWTLRVFEALIIAGGLGFVVLAALWTRGRDPKAPRTTLQVRVVLWMTAALLLVGFVEYAVVEWERTLVGLSVADKLSNAWFQSVTARTAGFNSVDLMPMHAGTLLTFIALMFVGASPGGTGGGIKTTTFAVLIAALPAVARGDVAIAMLGREIPPLTVLRASAITVVATLVAVLTTFSLALTQPVDLGRLGFEAVSALGTVGLSLNVTPTLDPFGRFVIIVAMFLGRVGPVSLALLLARKGVRRISYPTSRIMVG